MQKNYNRTLLPSAARDTTGSLDFTVPFGSKAMFFIDCTAGAGTLDVSIQARDPETGNVFTIRSFAQLTGSGSERVVIGDGADDEFVPTECTLLYTIGGATPSFTFSVAMSVPLD